MDYWTIISHRRSSACAYLHNTLPLHLYLMPGDNFHGHFACLLSNLVHYTVTTHEWPHLVLFFSLYGLYCTVLRVRAHWVLSFSFYSLGTVKAFCMYSLDSLKRSFCFILTHPRAHARIIYVNSVCKTSLCLILSCSSMFLHVMYVTER